MKPDLIIIVLVVFASMGLGWTFNLAAEFGLIGSFVCSIWLLYRAQRLHNWFTHIKKLPDAEQGIFYLLHRDIKKMREKHQKETRQLQRNLKQVFEASAALPDAVVIVDQRGTISWSNPLAVELLNIKQPRDNGHRITNLIRNPNFTTAYEQRQTKPLNLDMEAPTNRLCTINVKLVDLPQNQYMLVARDVSRHVNVNRAQKDFVSNVSHELKTPLTVMHGYLEMLEDKQSIDGSTGKAISDMLQQTKRMQSTIEDLLYLSKLENQSSDNPKQTYLEPINIRQILDGFMDSANLLAEQNKQNIILNIEDELSLLGNPQELQIAFSNLVTNAIRYTPTDGDITIEWQNQDNKVVFSVTDTGIGIAPNHISRLTERFYRVDQGRSREKGGTGLGLAIVKNVLERHDAELNISSELGKGSRFACVFSIDNA